jgi:hypothetical protein
MLIKKNM